MTINPETMSLIRSVRNKWGALDTGILLFAVFSMRFASVVEVAKVDEAAINKSTKSILQCILLEILQQQLIALVDTM